METAVRIETPVKMEVRTLMIKIVYPEIYKLLASERSERDTLRSVQLRIADIYIIGERAKRARHSQVCSIENRIYIMVRANFVLITRKEGGA